MSFFELRRLDQISDDLLSDKTEGFIILDKRPDGEIFRLLSSGLSIRLNQIISYNVLNNISFSNIINDFKEYPLYFNGQMQKVQKKYPPIRVLVCDTIENAAILSFPFTAYLNYNLVSEHNYILAKVILSNVRAKLQFSCTPPIGLNKNDSHDVILYSNWDTMLVTEEIKEKNEIKELFDYYRTTLAKNNIIINNYRIDNGFNPLNYHYLYDVYTHSFIDRVKTL